MAPDNGAARGPDGESQGIERALVLHPDRPGAPGARGPEARLEEAVGLAAAIDLTVVQVEIVRLAQPRPATLFGAGTVERFAERIRAQAIGIAIVDGSLTPVQQRNLEGAWNCKVIDRTGLILEIFGARARTKEGQLQVELAALSYQRSRLVRSWTHLERQRGGYGFLGGPGERQLEMDRRIITERITRLKAELEQVKRTRALHRTARRRVPYPVVALVGYTNAGKTTLFNALTQSEGFTADLLFATLDPAMRRIRLESGLEIILSDTVGFISDLPTDLIAAFRATLEEVTAADLIVHVRDVSHPDSEAQRRDVESVLGELGLSERLERDLIEVLNKIDLLDAESRDVLRSRAARERGSQVLCSALTGDGLPALLHLIDERLTRRRREVDLSVPVEDGATLAWLYDHGRVLSRRDEDREVHLRVSLEPSDLARFRRRQRGAKATKVPEERPASETGPR
ncbi:MAG TPA: GTPase HflX [Kiloniellales bacterium]|nr:GTPase HflX [Kiloniellales bacterium]